MTRSNGGPDLLALIEQAREATRELRGTLKDLKQARREAEALLPTLREALLAEFEAAREGVEQAVTNLQTWQQAEHARLEAEFDRIRREGVAELRRGLLDEAIQPLADTLPTVGGHVVRNLHGEQVAAEWFKGPVQDDVAAADRAWFDAHPVRDYRVRWSLPGEFPPAEVRWSKDGPVADPCWVVLVARAGEGLRTRTTLLQMDGAITREPIPEAVWPAFYEAAFAPDREAALADLAGALAGDVPSESEHETERDPAPAREPT